MKVVIFGATGMIGQGALREALLDRDVEKVLAVGRRPTGQTHPKLEELVHQDFTSFEPVKERLGGYDACLFCLGVSSAGMSEADYTRVTHDYTLAAARVLAEVNPSMTFIYVSGAGTDSSEKGRSMWARVKGRTENALLALPFKGYMFRPGFIQPQHGIQSSTKLYRVLYKVLGPAYPALKAIAPRYLTTTERVGRAMLRVAKKGAEKRVLESHEIDAIGA